MYICNNCSIVIPDQGKVKKLKEYLILATLFGCPECLKIIKKKLKKLK